MGQVHFYGPIVLPGVSVGVLPIGAAIDVGPSLFPLTSDAVINQMLNTAFDRIQGGKYCDRCQIVFHSGFRAPKENLHVLSWFWSLIFLSVTVSHLPCDAGHLLHSTLIFKVSIPITEGLDVIAMLTDDATIATWNNEGLPNDRMSTENATILTHCERWPLMIDPQQQGIKWIKNKYGTDLKVTHLGQKGYVKLGGLALCLAAVKWV